MLTDWWNVDRAKQLISFTGMPTGVTDIDGFTEYHDFVRIWYEVKYMDKESPLGQKLAYERLVKDAKEAGKYALAMIVEHAVHDPMQEVPLKDCNVREVYTSDELRWRPPRQEITAGELQKAFIAVCERREQRKCGMCAKSHSRTERQAV